MIRMIGDYLKRNLLNVKDCSHAPRSESARRLVQLQGLGECHVFVSQTVRTDSFRLERVCARNPLDEPDRKVWDFRLAHSARSTGNLNESAPRSETASRRSKFSHQALTTEPRLRPPEIERAAAWRRGAMSRLSFLSQSQLVLDSLESSWILEAAFSFSSRMSLNFFMFSKKSSLRLSVMNSLAFLLSPRLLDACTVIVSVRIFLKVAYLFLRKMLLTKKRPMRRVFAATRSN